MKEKTKKMRWKAFVIVMTLCLSGVVSGCGSGGKEQRLPEQETAVQTETASREQPLKIVCTAFPQYDFVRQIIGANPAKAQITYLLDSGVDMHNYQASAKDMMTIRDSDLLIYVGGESEEWIEEVLNQNQEEGMQALSLFDMVEVKREELVEGMEEEEEEETSDQDRDRDRLRAQPEELDEHVWLSLKNAVLMVGQIADTLCDLDPANAEEYQKNATAYTAQLADLDVRFAEMASHSARNTILVADRFPFRYLADDYQLEYFAAFPGCSAETEAGIETIVYLSRQVTEKQLPTVLMIDGSDGRIAQTVVENSADKNAAVKTLNSIQSVSADDIDAGVTYLGMMEDNLNILKEALN